MNHALHSSKDPHAVPVRRAALRVFAVMLTLSLMLIGNAALAQNFSASLSPATLPSAGGAFTMTANIDPNFEVGDIMLRAATTVIGPLTYVGVNSDGTKQYTISLTAPANNTTAPRVTAYNVQSHSTTGGLVTIAAGNLTVAAQPYITLTNITLNKNTLPANGGIFTITAKAYAAGGASISSIAVYRNGSNIGNLTYTPNSSDANNYTGNFALASNISDSPRNNLLTLRAQDNGGNVQAAVVGTLMQSAAAPVTIVSAAVSAATLPASGGSVTVTARLAATSPNSVSNVVLYRNGGNIGGLNYVDTNSDGSLNFAGTFAFSKNVAAAPAAYSLLLRVSDNAGNTVVQQMGTVAVAAASPLRVVSINASANALPASGGNVIVNAVVDVPAPNDVNALNVYRNGGSTGSLTYVSTNPDGTKNYSGTIAFAANQTNAPLNGALVLRATDAAGSVVSTPVAVVTTAAPAPVAIVSATVSANTLPAAGGSVTVNAVVKADAPNGINTVALYRNGGYLGSLAFVNANSDGTKNYTGAFAIPAASNNATKNILMLSARDNNANFAYQFVDTVTVGTAVTGTPVQVVSTTLTNKTLTADGGNCIVTARIKNPTASSINGLSVYTGTDYVGQLVYQYNNNDGTLTYAGSFAISRNARAAANAFPVTLLVSDSAGNQDAANVGTVTQAAVTPLAVPNASLVTATFPASGGYEVVNATLKLASPNTVYAVSAYVNGAFAANLTYLYPNADGTANYIGAFSVPVNRTALSHADTVSLIAADNAGSSVIVPLGSYSVAPVAPVRIVTASLTSGNLPAAGGNAVITATVAVPAPNSVYSVTVYNNGAYIGALNYLNSNSDGTANYLGAFDIAANRTDIDRTDALTLLATDNAGNAAVAVPGNVFVHGAVPIAITASAISVKPSGTLTGDAIISATIKVVNPNGVSDMQVTSNGPYVGTLRFQSMNADGTANYSGSFPLPTSSNNLPQPFLFTLTAFDSLGNIATAVLNPSSGMITPVSLSGTVTLEGEVVNAALQTVTFEFRPDDGSDNFTRTAGVGQDGIFHLNDIPRKSYTVRVKSEKNLAQIVPVDTTNGDVTNFTVTLPGGDATNDNAVDIGDFGLLVNAYGSDASIANSGYDPRPDFNGDGTVDIADFGILVNSYGKTGDN